MRKYRAKNPEGWLLELCLYRYRALGEDISLQKGFKLYENLFFVGGSYGYEISEIAFE